MQLAQSAGLHPRPCVSSQALQQHSSRPVEAAAARAGPQPHSRSHTSRGAPVAAACLSVSSSSSSVGGAVPAPARTSSSSSSSCLHQRQHLQQHRTLGRVVVCRAAPEQQQQTDWAKYANQAYLDKAAARFRLGVEQGLEEDLLVAVELGATSLDELSEAQQEYADKIRDKLVKRAGELAAEEKERRKREAAFLEAGKKAYERGQYDDSVGFLEKAVEQAGRTSIMGGEALMWLALAYQACDREQECIDTYKWLEDNHPVPKVKKQAADLRYIMEAPKMELSPEERVTIPLLNSEDSWVKKGRKSPYTPRYNAGAPKAPTKKGNNYWDNVDWEAPQLPFLGSDKWYVRVAWVVVLVGSAVYLNMRYGSLGS